MEQLTIMPSRIRIAAILRKAILAGEFTQGEEIQLTEIANRLGVSRTPVREAFQMLEADGLIELRMNKGAIVRGINSKFIIDHYEMRMLLEGEAVYRATVRKMDTHKIMQLNEQVLQDLKSGDISSCVDVNQIIHSEIWKAADNEKLYKMLMNIWNGPSIGKTTTSLSHHQKSALEHKDVILCIMGNEPERGRTAMTKHIQRSMQNILDSFAMGH